MSRSFLTCAVVWVLETGALAQCPSQGLTLVATGNRLGDPASLQVSGAFPFAPGGLGVDTAPGPTLTPIG